jgi:RNA polymerase sigma-70 factor (ECF subfamily)
MSVLETIEETERKKMVQDCIASLDEEDRFLVTLYYFHESSLKEISQIMKINENNLKIKLYRARKKLAGLFKLKIEPEIIDGYGK